MINRKSLWEFSVFKVPSEFEGRTALEKKFSRGIISMNNYFRKKMYVSEIFSLEYFLKINLFILFIYFWLC